MLRRHLTEMEHAVEVKRDERQFVIGVLNLMFSSWLIGAYPYAYWVYHSAKLIVLMTIRVFSFTQKKMQFWLLDYCYVINYTSILYFACCVLKAYAPSCAPMKAIDYWGPTVFRIAFSACVGPLAISILAFRNSLIFHSPDHITILAVHLSPNIAVWGMRWWVRELNETFQDTFHVGCGLNPPSQFNLFFSTQDCPGDLIDLYCWPLAHYCVCWNIPYALFFFVFARRMLEDGGYSTMYEDMQKQEFVRKILSIGGESGKPIKYMLMHGFGVACIMFMGPLLWHSFALHTIYLSLLVLVSINNGSTFYFEVACV